MMDLAQILTDFRKTSGKSQQKFAEMLGVPQTTWSGYESGKFQPPMKVLMALERNGYTIPGLSSNLSIDLKSSLDSETYADVLELLKVTALKKSPDIYINEDLGKIINEELKNLKRPSGRFLLELDKIILKAMESHITTIHEHESRISALENHLKSVPGAEPSKGTGGDNVYTVETDPEYGGAVYSHLLVAESEPTPEYMTRSIAFCDDIAAGPPIWQSEDKGRVVDVPYHLIKASESDYYALRVKGNSMIDAFIPDGSMVLIKKSDVPQHGKIQVIWLDDRVTLKRMREDKDHSWTLCYEDGTGRTIPLGENNQVQGTFEAVLPPATKPRMRGE